MKAFFCTLSYSPTKEGGQVGRGGGREEIKKGVELKRVREGGREEGQGERRGEEGEG